ncbi:MAG: hypothetical protein AAB038_03135 [Planctomycetota bacterium]
MKEPEVLNEIHRIRKAHYKHTKGNSHHAVMKAVEQRASKLLKQYRITLPVYHKPMEPASMESR